MVAHSQDRHRSAQSGQQLLLERDAAVSGLHAAAESVARHQAALARVSVPSAQGLLLAVRGRAHHFRHIQRWRRRWLRRRWLRQTQHTLLQHKEYLRYLNDIIHSLSLSLNGNYDIYSEISNVFGVGTQEDASEFFTTLLEHMAKAIKFSSSSTTSPNQITNGSRPNNHHHHHNINNKRSHTILDDIFAFQFRSRSN